LDFQAACKLVSRSRLSSSQRLLQRGKPLWARLISDLQTKKGGERLFKHLILVLPTVALGDVALAGMEALCVPADVGGGAVVFGPSEAGLHLVMADMCFDYMRLAARRVREWVGEEVAAGRLVAGSSLGGAPDKPRGQAEILKQAEAQVAKLWAETSQKLEHFSLTTKLPNAGFQFKVPSLDAFAQFYGCDPSQLSELWGEMGQLIGYDGELEGRLTPAKRRRVAQPGPLAALAPSQSPLSATLEESDGLTLGIDKDGFVTLQNKSGEDKAVNKWSVLFHWAGAAFRSTRTKQDSSIPLKLSCDTYVMYQHLPGRTPAPDKALVVPEKEVMLLGDLLKQLQASYKAHQDEPTCTLLKGMGMSVDKNFAKIDMDRSMHLAWLPQSAPVVEVLHNFRGWDYARLCFVLAYKPRPTENGSGLCAVGISMRQSQVFQFLFHQ
jgi:hypothetical protein